ncbi:MAG: YtxH domain-containing protein [Flavobacteriaceae bacterium]|nr:YtxH domain-containing protein [Bacteroidia bacterium]MBT8288870.1 YtxH domain-containing protein [Bacteroidia bacterium]NNF74393.1 YtxH domain-containing protein [Flavobacteriaceae bacterium]NNK72554.1 YtxH domain-containing protein [Flavobacteriaceae bacterium]
MSDENKDLRDDLNDMLGDAKEGARKAADKAEELAQEAKEKASEFAEEAKEKAKEFAGDAKEVFSDGKNVAIIAHLTVIGWVIAVIMNSTEKNEFASFYIRQMLGLMLMSIIMYFIPVVGWIANILIFVLWVISLVGAIGGEKKETVLLGKQFQEWFKSI